MPKIYCNELKIAIINFKNSSYWNISNAIKIFNVSKSSIYGWISLYKNGLLIKESNMRTLYKSKITPEIEKYVKLYVLKRVTFNCKNLNRCIRNIFNKTISVSSIYKILKKNNMSYKKVGKKIIPENRNIEKQIINLKQEIKKYDSDKIISIDETHFDTHMCPKYGWSSKGEPIKKIIGTPIRKRKTLTLAVTKDEIVGYNIINNSSNSKNFENFLKESVLNKIENGAILMDNAKIHHSKAVKDCVNKTTNKIIYNVAYNPETNPIEFCFSEIKRFVSKKEPKTDNQLIKEIEKSLKTITESKLKAFFKHSLNI